MNNFLNVLSQMNFGEILLAGFWSTCVVMFYSCVLYIIYNVVKEGVTNLIKKVKVKI